MDAMSRKINYDNYTNEELQRVATTVNRQLFPERAAIIDAKLAERLSAAANSAPASAPVSQPQQRVLPDNLASRGERFAAAIIDVVVNIIAIIPFVMFIGLDALKNPTMTTVLYNLGYSFLVLFVVHGYLLINYSQTVGKHFLNIQINNLDGSRAKFSNIVLARILPMWLVNLVPLLGPVIVGLIDPLMIFNRERRCLHDLVAGTQVLRMPQEATQSA